MRQEKGVAPKKCNVCGVVSKDVRKVGKSYAYNTDKNLLDKYMCFECTYEVWLQKGVAK